jgi:hypothetical protein
VEAGACGFSGSEPALLASNGKDIGTFQSKTKRLKSETPV